MHAVCLVALLRCMYLRCSKKLTGSQLSLHMDLCLLMATCFRCLMMLLCVCAVRCCSTVCQCQLFVTQLTCMCRLACTCGWCKHSHTSLMKVMDELAQDVTCRLWDKLTDSKLIYSVVLKRFIRLVQVRSFYVIDIQCVQDKTETLCISC